MSLPNIPFSFVSPLNVIPNPIDDTENFLYFFNRFYEEVASAITDREIPYYQIAVTTAATNIPFLPTFGSYILCVSGDKSDLPVKTWSLVKSTEDAVGVINVLGTQAGSGSWAATNLTITSTATNFQIAHDRAGITETFNIKWIGTKI